MLQAPPQSLVLGFDSQLSFSAVTIKKIIFFYLHLSIFRFPYIFMPIQISIQYPISSEWKTSFTISHSLSLLTIKSFSFFVCLFVFVYFAEDIVLSSIFHLEMGMCLPWQLAWATESTYLGVDMGLLLVIMKAFSTP